MPRDYPIQPFNFTKYSVNDLFHYYGVNTEEEKKTRALLIFGHWVAHPEKGATDLIQSSFYEGNDGMIHSLWRRISEIEIHAPDGRLLGNKIIYYLIDTQQGHPVASSGFKIEVYEAPDYYYNNIPNQAPHDVRVKVSVCHSFTILL